MARKRKAVEAVKSTVVEPRATADDQPAPEGLEPRASADEPPVEQAESVVAEPIESTAPEIVDPSDPVARPDSRERITSRAYEIYLERGGGHGQDLDDWLEAERQTGDDGEGPHDD